MVNLLAGITATIITLPVLGIIVIYLFLRLFLKNKRKSLFLTIDLSTFLLVISTHFVLLVLFGQSFLWVIITLLLAIIFIFALVDWSLTEQLNVKKVIKQFWRFTFLLFGTSYFLILLSGLVYRIIQSY